MHIEKFSWFTHRLEKDMVIMRYGHYGPGLLYFPTSGGGHTEFDYYRMQDDAWPFIRDGRVQVFVVDGYAKTSWYNDHLHPRKKIEGHLAYESYVINEVVPFIYNVTKNDYLGCMGASFGGYYAINSLFRYPQIFKTALSLGGVFDITSHLDGYTDEDVYFNNPAWYVRNLDDPFYRSRIGHSAIPCLWGGVWDQFIQSTYDFHELLNSKGIPHDYDVWGPPFGHNEKWWKIQLPVWLDRYY
ncbi:MAG: alpha/beta hydrolase-fold protein [Planctomycetes bacterium]|nr:alpha/beta hydrolase-fold protein [Planctomycetota bacterium]